VVNHLILSFTHFYFQFYTQKRELMRYILYYFLQCGKFSLPFLAFFLLNCSRESFNEFTKSEGFQKFCGCPVKKKPGEVPLSAAGSESEVLGSLEVGSVEAHGDDFYLHRFYEGLRKSYIYSGTKLTETPTGVKGPGFEIKRIEEVYNGVPQLKALVFTLEGDTGFSGNSTNLNSKAKPILERLGNAFVAYPETEIKIFGHTDSPGDFNKNIELSRERAKVIKSELQSGRKISEDAFKEVEGLADQRKAIETKRAEPKNRRIEILIETIKPS
jgi:outer membrane protein OmpA-like peptidoglycan-associated protein